MRICTKEIFLLRCKLRRSDVWNITSGQIVQKLKLRKRSEWTSSHHRKMRFEGDWGCCPNKRMSKSSKQGPVYTACQFVNGQNITQTISNLRILSLCHLWSVRPQAEILFSHFWIYAQLGYKDFEKSLVPTCSRFGNKWNARYHTSRQFGEK